MYNLLMIGDLSQDELARYSRHLLIPEVGQEGQRKLKAASVLIVGAGGLGSAVALYLAAAGIGRIGLVDDDVVEISNLQRQVLFTTSDNSKAKVDSAREHLLALNPTISVDSIRERFTTESAERIAAGYDILVDCADNFGTRYLISDLCVLTSRSDVYGAVSRFEGQVSIFDARSGPCYRCLFPNPLPPELTSDNSKMGVLGVLPGVIGTLQATEVIKLALNLGQPLIGRMIAFDALTSTFQTLKVAKSVSCRVCGQHPTITNLGDSI